MALGSLLAGFALEAVGTVNTYMTQRSLMKAQEEAIETQQRLAELDAKIKERQARAEARALQGAFVATNTAKGAQYSSTFTGGIQSIQSLAEQQSYYIQEENRLAQQYYDTRLEAIQKQTPSILDLALGIGGLGVQYGTEYLNQQAELKKNQPTTTNPNLSLNPVGNLTLPTQQKKELGFSGLNFNFNSNL